MAFPLIGSLLAGLGSSAVNGATNIASEGASAASKIALTAEDIRRKKEETDNAISKSKREAENNAMSALASTLSGFRY